MKLRLRYLIPGLLCLSVASMLSARDWTTLDGVAFEENQANDGDSFHAKRNRSTYLFRLYFVDTPETDLRYPDRVKEQADYFGVSTERAVEGAKEAVAFTAKLLQAEKFTVYTRYADARGASDMKRYYAMVKVGERWLSECLVEAGYARVFGQDTDLPDGTEAKKYWSRLRKLEKEAKEAKRGLWGGGEVVAGEGQALKLPRITTIYQKEPPHGAVGNLPAGWEVQAGPPGNPGFREVTFISPGGSEFRGWVLESALK